MVTKILIVLFFLEMTLVKERDGVDARICPFFQGTINEGKKESTYNVHDSRANVFKNRIDKCLVRTG